MNNPILCLFPKVLYFQSARSRKATICLLGPQSGAAPWTRPLSPPSGSCPACLDLLGAPREAWCRQQSCTVALLFSQAGTLLDTNARLACRLPPVLCCSLFAPMHIPLRDRSWRKYPRTRPIPFLFLWSW